MNLTGRTGQVGPVDNLNGISVFLRRQWLFPQWGKSICPAAGRASQRAMSPSSQTPLAIFWMAPPWGDIIKCVTNVQLHHGIGKRLRDLGGAKGHGDRPRILAFSYLGRLHVFLALVHI